MHRTLYTPDIKALKSLIKISFSEEPSSAPSPLYTAAAPFQLQASLETSFQCEQCDFRTPVHSNLQKHVEVEHTGALYSCSKCAFTANLPTEIVVHVRICHVEFVFVCTACLYLADGPTKLRNVSLKS